MSHKRKSTKKTVRSLKKAQDRSQRRVDELVTSIAMLERISEEIKKMDERELILKSPGILSLLYEAKEMAGVDHPGIDSLIKDFAAIAHPLRQAVAEHKREIRIEIDKLFREPILKPQMGTICTTCNTREARIFVNSSVEGFYVPYCKRCARDAGIEVKGKV